jgi:MoxR-like ATPase
MSRHEVDLSKEYQGMVSGEPDGLPESRMIEDPDPRIVLAAGDDFPRRKVEAEPYLPDPVLVTNVNLAIALGRPLLLQGEPGCGKTRLAYAVAYELGMPLEECYIKSTSRAQDLLYKYDAINRLYDVQASTPEERRNGKVHNIRDYISLGPLGQAIARAQCGRRSVVLIDEIDKADLDFPNDLLYELDRLAFHVAEAPEMRYAVPEKRPDLRPIVIVTHNEEKALPAAFLRRCIYYYLSLPRDSRELEQFLLNALKKHKMEDETLNVRAIQTYQKLLPMGLEKKPGLSELLDWVGYLTAQKQHGEDPQPEKLPNAGALLKNQSDLNRIKEEGVLQ